MKKLNFTWTALLLTIILLPFERLLTFELSGFTVKPAYVVVIALLASETYQIISGKIRPSLQLEEYLLLGLVFWAYLSSFWSLNPSRTLIMSSLLLFMVLAFMLVRRKTTTDTAEIIKGIIVWIGFALSLFAILQFFIEPHFGYQLAGLREQYGSRVFGFPRLQGTFLEPLYLANFLIWPILFMNYELRIKNKGYWKLIILLVAFILTLSRGAYLGIAVALILIIVAGAILKKVNSRFMAGVVASTVAAVAISIFMVFMVAGRAGVTTFVEHAMSSRDLTPQTKVELLKNRETSTGVARYQIAQHPITGIGYGSFGSLPVFKILRDRGEMQTVNNEYLEIAAETGAIGFVIFLAFMTLLLLYIFGKIKGGDTKYLFYSGAVVALLLQYLTFSTLNLLYIWVFMAVIWPVTNQKVKS